MTLVISASAVPAPALQPGLLRSLQEDAHPDQPGFEERIELDHPWLFDWGKSVQPSVIELTTSVDGHTTFQLELMPVGNAESVHALYGHSEVPLELPPAFHVAVPFGSHFGGTPSDIWAFSPDAQYDSFLFAAPTTDMPGYRAIPAGYLSSVGIDFDDWTADSGLSITDGAVFVMDPDNAAAGPVVAAQVTVPAGVSFTASMGAQGHNMLDRDWQVANGISNPEIRQSWNQEQIVWNVTPSGKQAGTVGH